LKKKRFETKADKDKPNNNKDDVNDESTATTETQHSSKQTESQQEQTEDEILERKFREQFPDYYHQFDDIIIEEEGREDENKYSFSTIDSHNISISTKDNMEEERSYQIQRSQFRDEEIFQLCKIHTNVFIHIKPHFNFSHLFQENPKQLMVSIRCFFLFYIFVFMI
jgi:hypothetical protein